MCLVHRPIRPGAALPRPDFSASDALPIGFRYEVRPEAAGSSPLLGRCLPHQAFARQRRARQVHEREFGRVDHSGDRGDEAVGDGEVEEGIGTINLETALTNFFNGLNRTVGEPAGRTWG